MLAFVRIGGPFECIAILMLQKGAITHLTRETRGILKYESDYFLIPIIRCVLTSNYSGIQVEGRQQLHNDLNQGVQYFLGFNDF